jgi:hypothetical protein
MSKIMYNKRKCKECKKVFEKKQPLQYVCSPICAINYAKKKEKSKWQKEKKQRLIDLESIRGIQSKYIQPKVNELVRIIDNSQPCIASGTFGKQNAGHYYHAGGNPQIRFNLHNIHIQSFHSNSALAGDVLRYREGIKRVYGLDYLEFMDSLTQTPTIKRTKTFYLELNNKLIEVKKWLKTQTKGQIQDSASRIRLRNEVNLLLGIYNKEYCIFK